MEDLYGLGGDRTLLLQARKDFDRLRRRETLSRIRGVFKTRKDRLLSLSEVKRILRPTSEAYRGIMAVPVSLIVGSEGRYNDFTRSFLPRHAKTRTRWMRVNVARSKNVAMPAVQLYELGGAFFIRDGNHRVSVAVQQGVKFIDAEVTSLATYFKIDPAMTTEEMEAAVVEYERVHFLSETHIDDLIPHFEMYFSSPGRYDVVLSHIIDKREQMRRRAGTDVSLPEAIRSWYADTYEPVLQAIREQNILASFPGRTPSDLYVWIMDHGEQLRKKHGKDFAITDAAANFRSEHRRSLASLILSALTRAEGGRQGRR